MFSESWLQRFRDLLAADPEMEVVGDWFSLSMSLTSGDDRCIVRFERGRLVQWFVSPKLGVTVRIRFSRQPGHLAEVSEPPSRAAVSRCLRDADARPRLRARRRLARRHAARASAASRDEGHATGGCGVNLEPIVGRYLQLRYNELDYRIFFEEAGQGVPLLCLHTAGADSRQYRHLLNDAEVTKRFRVIAFDLPYHGRSTPPSGWWLKKYRLTTNEYLSLTREVWQALALERPVVLGCSMGGAIVLKLAAEYQSELRGIVGLESTAYAPGRYNDYLHHPAIHGGEMTASYTYGLCAPQSPEVNARENWWYYTQAGPGVYAGDVHYYSNDWDGRQDITRIDTRVCKVSLLTGEFDYSCTPEMSLAVAEAIPGSRVTVMKGIGHFPMIENYPLFRDYLLAELDAIVPATTT